MSKAINLIFLLSVAAACLVCTHFYNLALTLSSLCVVAVKCTLKISEIMPFEKTHLILQSILHLKAVQSSASFKCTAQNKS